MKIPPESLHETGGIHIVLDLITCDCGLGSGGVSHSCGQSSK